MNSKDIRSKLLRIKREIEEQIDYYRAVNIKFELIQEHKIDYDKKGQIKICLDKIPGSTLNEKMNNSKDYIKIYNELEDVEDLNFSGNFKEMGDIANKVLNSECISDNRGNLEGYYSDLGDICQEVADDFEEIEFDSFENVIELLREIVDKISEIA